MNTRVQHLVPLSREALGLLMKRCSITGASEYLLPLMQDPTRPLHSAALSCGLRSLGFSSQEVAPHGFRATACTLLISLAGIQKSREDP
jgi:integrase